MTIQLITAANAGYMDKIKPYLDTQERHGANLERYFICVKTDPPEAIADCYPDLILVQADAAQVEYSPTESESLQHGSWLDVVPGKDEDTAIFTDGDIFMQRPLNASELDALENWPENTFGVSWNNGAGETLIFEALVKLNPKVSDADFIAHWGRLTVERPVFNVGVMVGKRSAFRALRAAYEKRWGEVGEYLSHGARQQWLLSYLIHSEGFGLRVLPYTFHTHAHFDLPEGALIAKAGDCYYNNEAVAFWHVPMWMRR